MNGYETIKMISKSLKHIKILTLFLISAPSLVPMP